MIDTKKEQERDELHRAIWAIADELRGNRAFIEPCRVWGDWSKRLNLLVSTHVEQNDKSEKVDIFKLNAKIKKIAKQKNVLRKKF